MTIFSKFMQIYDQNLFRLEERWGCSTTLLTVLTALHFNGFDLSIRDTAIDKKYFSTGPLMFNVPNKTLIT